TEERVQTRFRAVSAASVDEAVGVHQELVGTVGRVDDDVRDIVPSSRRWLLRPREICFQTLNADVEGLVVVVEDARCGGEVPLGQALAGDTNRYFVPDVVSQHVDPVAE